MKRYLDKKSESKFTGTYNIGLSGPHIGNDMEDKAYEKCVPIKEKLDAFYKREEVTNSETVKYFKSQLAKNPEVVKAYEKGGTSINQLKFHDIKKFSDWCVTTNTDGKSICPENVWEAVQDMYDFKFYGILNLKDNLVCSAVFGAAFVKTLKDFQANPTATKEKLHLWVKSDTLIGRFYTLMGIIPSREYYVTKFRENDDKLILPHRPLFADNLTTEISENKNGEFMVRLIRNGILQSVCDKSKTECSLGDFIKMIESR